MMEAITLPEWAARIGAVEDDQIPGLWHLEGYPELTTGQLLCLFLTQPSLRGQAK